jgi:hypothetical protein
MCVRGDFRVDQLATVRSEARQGARLILAHEAAVSSDICCENGGKPPLDPVSAQRSSRE